MVQSPAIPAVIRPPELAELLSEHPEIRLLDVRTPTEYETVHIRGAYNVPLDLLSEHGAEIRINVAEPVVLVCQSGQRARKAEEALKAAGMPNLHVLDGGVNGWVAAGNPVVRRAERLSLERQVRIAAGALAAIGGIMAVFINPLFALLPAVVGSGLVFAGVTNTCGMAMLLTRLPYNRVATCDVAAMVRALKSGAPPAPSTRAETARRAPACPAC
ncbi:MAG TPA: rhodanese-like domain-containing protein [Gemmatimonadaceae bacterium]|nr:rhodanese-like domain-containing protein [Gemmatimonadaceae bacterium]